MTEAHAAITLQKVLRGSRARLEHRQRTTYVSRKERRRRGARPDSPAQATPPPQGEAEAAAPEAAGSGGDSQPTERTARGGFKRPNPVLKAGRRQEVQHGEDMRRVFDWFDRDRDGGTPALYLPHVSRTSPAGAQMVGLAQGALDLTLPYVHERRQFGSRIADFQAVQHCLAQASS